MRRADCAGANPPLRASLTDGVCFGAASLKVLRARGFPLSVLRRFSLCGSSLFLSAISGAWFPHPKIPFLADKALAGGCGCVERSHSRRIHDGRFAGVRYCCGVKPSASNWRDHSAGASRSRAMLTPRGRRPSTAARTSLGARKASEIVMLT